MVSVKPDVNDGSKNIEKGDVCQTVLRIRTHS